MTWHRVIGQIPSKSNLYRISGGRMYKAEEVTKYELAFAAQTRHLRDAMIGDFEVELRAYFPDKRQDLDGCFKVFFDCLQKIGAIQNDRKCQAIQAWRHVDKQNPRIEFKLYERHDD